MQIYIRKQFGNPILRKVGKKLTIEEIKSSELKLVINNMKNTLSKKKYGIGLAAPQIGKSIALAVISLKPTPTRPNLQNLNMTLVNPKITKRYGKTTKMWEGCISGPNLYGQALRYKKIKLKWQDEQANQNEKIFKDILAQVIQHEVDHINGILFVDRVKDTKTFITFSEYKKLRKKENITKKP